MGLTVNDLYGWKSPVSAHPSPSVSQAASGPLETGSQPAIAMIAIIGILVVIALLWGFSE